MSEPKRAGGTKNPPAPVPHLFGFCQSEAQAMDGNQPTGTGSEWHARCPGALTTGVGSVVVCTCPAHGDHRKCHVCLTEVEAAEGYDPIRRQHTNQEACQIAADLRRSANGHLTAQIAAIREETRQRREQQRAEENRLREERGERPVRLRTKAAPKAPQRCHCGCGSLTKGGRFVPGHDAKLKGRLGQARSAQDTHADYVEALAERIARGWLPGPEHPAWQQEKPEMLPVLTEAQALVEQAGGVEQYIALAVADRYGD